MALMSRRLFLAAGASASLVGLVPACAKKELEGAGHDLVRTSSQGLLEMGFYSWDELTWMPDRISWLGLPCARIGGGLSDEIMTLCSTNSIDVLFAAGSKGSRSDSPDDETFINGFLENIDEGLKKYGPDGSFWASNPTLSYKPVINVEVGNEPNYGYGFNGTQAEIAALYSRVLIASYDHIKKIWPQVSVVGIAAGGASATAPAFVSAVLAELHSAGRLDCLDVVSIHSYMGGSPPDQVITESWGSWVASEQIAKVVELMGRYGVDKPLWITEAGYAISQAEGGRYSKDNPAIGASVSLLQQAGYSIRLDMAAIRFGASRTYHMFLLDTDEANAGWFDYSPEHNPRPVAVAMRQLNKLVSGATVFEVVLDGYTRSDGAFAYRLTTPRGWVIVGWSQNPVQVAIPCDFSESAAVIDMLGNPIAKGSGLQEYFADLTELPIFITAEA